MARGSIAVDDIPDALAQVFEQAQTSASSHRKNCVGLFKVQKQTANITEVIKGKGGSTKLVGERAFCDAFIQLLNRVLVVKKGVQAADRVVRFVGTYLRFVNEKGACFPSPL
jgi:condensin complex subunit 3